MSRAPNYPILTMDKLDRVSTLYWRVSVCDMSYGRAVVATENCNGHCSSKLRTFSATCTHTFSIFTFIDHLNICVGQSSSFSSTVCFQSCQLSVHIFPVVVDPSLSRLPPSSLPRYNHVIIFFSRSSSLLLICPYQFYLFCLGNVDIWHTLASSCMSWFLTWSFLVLPLIHRSILISATCNLFSSFFLTAQHSAPYVIVGLITVLK